MNFLLYNSKTIAKRRSFIIGLGQLLGSSLLIGRMINLQIIQGQQYHTMAEGNRIHTRFIIPNRGLLYSKDGNLIADNKPNYKVLLHFDETSNPEESIEKLIDIIKIPAPQADKLRSYLTTKNREDSITLLENISWQDFSTVSLSLYKLPGIHIDSGQIRFYPYQQAFAHITGYVGLLGRKDIRHNPKIPNRLVGKVGIEYNKDNKLRGKAGYIKYEVNNVGQIIRELEKQPPTAGQNQYLTLDSRLQRKIYDRIGAESGSCIVLHVPSNQINAMVSTPSYNPNDFIGGISHKNWQELLNNKKSPLMHKAISGQYPPGSTFKMITALAALHYGIINQNTQIYCPGYHDSTGSRFHCWKRGGHGYVSLANALAQSCDVYFYEIALKVGIERLYEVAKIFGIGERPNIDMNGVKSGLMPHRHYPKNTVWRPGDTLMCGIGQGKILTTPLQLAIMTARLATGRKVDTFSLFTENHNPVINEKLPFDPQHLEIVRQAMFSVVNDKQYGTAYKARLQNTMHPNWLMAGKTGTAQVRRISMQERRTGVLANDKIAWKYRDHALFVAYAPFESPEFVASVVIEHGGSGSTIAAPIARYALEQALLLSHPISKKENHETIL